jgi:hypothetical protein
VFSGLQFYSGYPLASARYRVDGGGWSAISVGTYTDLFQAIQFITDTPTELTTQLFELELTNSNSPADVIVAGVDVVCDITTGWYSGTVNYVEDETFMRPFAGVKLGDVTYIDKVEYQIFGVSTKALTEIIPTVYFSGTHDGGDNESFLTDSSAGFLSSRIVVGTDIVKNTTKSEQADITATTATTITGTLSGGADWDDGNTYEVIDGSDIERVVNKFQIEFDATPTIGSHLVKLTVTDTSANAVVHNFSVEVL